MRSLLTEISRIRIFYRKSQSRDLVKEGRSRPTAGAKRERASSSLRLSPLERLEKGLDAGPDLGLGVESLIPHVGLEDQGRGPRLRGDDLLELIDGKGDGLAAAVDEHEAPVQGKALEEVQGHRRPLFKDAVGEDRAIVLRQGLQGVLGRIALKTPGIHIEG